MCSNTYCTLNPGLHAPLIFIKDHVVKLDDTRWLVGKVLLPDTHVTARYSNTSITTALWDRHRWILGALGSVRDLPQKNEAGEG